MANEHLFQISSIKMIESSKKKIAPEIHLMTKQKELICLVGIAFIKMYKSTHLLFLYRKGKTWRRYKRGRGLLYRPNARRL